MKKARSYKSKHRPVVPLDSLQSAIATAEGAVGRKRAASFLVRAAELIDKEENGLCCCAIDEAHRERFGLYCEGSVLLVLPEGRLFSALYESDRARDEQGHVQLGWFDPVNVFQPFVFPARVHRIYALLFAAAMMLDP